MSDQTTTDVAEVLARVTRLWEEDQASGALATEPGDIPVKYEAITSEWLTHILCKDHPGAEVSSFTLDEPDDGNSNRRRIFVEYNAAGQAAGLPASVFCKATIGLANRFNLGNCGGLHSEVTFYRVARPLIDIDAPVALHAAYDSESFNSIVVLHDLGGQVEFCDETTRIDLEKARSQVDVLAAVHSEFQDDPEGHRTEMGFDTWPQWFGAAARNDLAEYCGKGFHASRSFMPARLYERADEIWPATLEAVEEHNHLPHSLLMGDCHLKQWYIRPSGTMGLGDWQNACFGNWARDVSYMLSTSLAIEDRRAWERDLLARYLEQRVARGSDMPSFDDAWLLYRRNLLPALAWWTVTLTPGPNYSDMQPPAASVEFITRMTQAIDDLDALDAFGGR